MLTNHNHLKNVKRIVRRSFRIRPIPKKIDQRPGTVARGGVPQNYSQKIDLGQGDGTHAQKHWEGHPRAKCDYVRWGHFSVTGLSLSREHVASRASSPSWGANAQSSTRTHRNRRHLTALVAAPQGYPPMAKTCQSSLRCVAPFCDASQHLTRWPSNASRRHLAE